MLGFLDVGRWSGWNLGSTRDEYAFSHLDADLAS